MRHGFAVLAGLILLASTTFAQAQSVMVEVEYGKKVHAAKSVDHLNSTAFGNQTSDSTGQTVFSTFDVDLPGNNKLPVRFGRRLPIGIRYFDQELSGLGSWDVEVPYIEGTFSKQYGWSVDIANSPNRYKRCTRPSAPMVEGGAHTTDDFFNGYNIHVPGLLDGSLLIDTTAYQDPTDGKTYPWILKSMDRVGCLPSLKNGHPGEGFVLLTKDGIRYYFDFMVERKASTLQKGAKGCDGGLNAAPCAALALQRKRLFLLATRIEDRFGNYVDYQYDALGRPQSIIASDGRAITAQYGENSVSVSAHGRTWLYTMDQGYLASVRNPDGSEWKYTPFGMPTQVPGLWNPGPDLLPSESFNPDDHCLTPRGTGNYWGNVNFQVTHPSGAKGDFEFWGQTFYRSNVFYTCNIIFTNVEGTSGSAQVITPNYFDTTSLLKLSISGPGISPEITRYEYGVEFYPYCNAIFSANGQPAGPACSEQGYVEDPCVGPYAECTDSLGRWVTTTRPDGTKIRKRFGVKYGVNEGMLLAEELLDSTGAVVSHTDYQYLPDAVAGNQSFGSVVGYPTYTADPMASIMRPIVSTQVVQGGVTYKNDVQLCDGTKYCFTPFAQPTKVRKWNSLGVSRTDITEYENNLSVWVLGQIKRTYNIDAGSIIEFEAAYNAQALPLWSKRFGKLQQSITYNVDGTVATVADGKDNTITLSNWKRGIPQLIHHPATAEAQSGATESATVNDSGWITSVTDETGAVTGYGYDAMGRLASVVYPTADDVSYFATQRNFQPVAAGDWKPEGISAGQWRQTEITGNHTAVTYMDALWRPILTHEYDSQNIAATMRSSKTAYDTSGRVSFQSYPSSQTIPGNTGTRTLYDALDRVTRVEQDSEHGVLTTTTQYLSGLKTLVTNPRGFSVTTSFMAWDQPAYDFPILSEQPEGKVIQISRHPQFGWPLQLTQRNASGTLSVSRRYVYDGNAQLCKTIEPETGVAVMGYDDAGNLVWQASGLDGTSTAYNSTIDCQHGAAYAAGRTSTRTYDARNRLTHLNFPNGGQGNQIWTYKKDNLPESVTTYNDINNATPVVTTYAYNNRRLLIGETLAQPGWYSWSVGYAYNAYGHLSTQTYPTGLVVDYAPNPLGQPTKAGTYASGVQYYPNGALKQFTYGNGIVHTMTQNARQLPLRVTATGNAMDYEYGYDPNGNVAHVLDHVTGTPTARHRWMGYDNLDRLTTVASAVFGGSDHTHRFTYDVLDNLKSWKHAGVKDYADYVYDSQNRLGSIRNTAGATVVGLSYDPQGNLANKNGQTYQFDFGNRLRAVTSKEAYRYDGLGRRVLAWEPTTNSILSQYTQSGQVIYQEDHRTSIASEHVYLAGSLIASRERNWVTNVYATKYQHTDALGSPVAVTNASGQVIERMDYEPWGAIIGKPNHNGIGYTGHVMDGATGLTYMQQRYYDQSVGRFLSVDPVTAHEKLGQNFNRYWYANNNPYMFVDPDGRVVRAVDGIPERNAAIEAALKTIDNSSSDLRNKLQSMRDSEHPHEIRFPLPGESPENRTTGIKENESNPGVGTGSLTIVDPTSEVFHVNSDGTGVFSSGVTVLVHELLGHGGDKDNGVMDRTVNPETGEKRSEERAMEVENKYKDHAGEKKRDCHSDC